MNIDEKIVFAVTESEPGVRDPLTLLVGIPEAAWELLKNGKTHSVTLESLGLPMRFILYAAKDHNEALQVINAHNVRVGKPAQDMRYTRDFGIKGKPNGD